MTAFHMKIAAVIPVCAALVACGSHIDRAKLAEDRQHFDATVAGIDSDLQWRLDKATAESLWVRRYSDAPDVVTANYYMFVKCHEEPPTHEANKRACAVLQGRVSKAEAAADANRVKEKAGW